MIGTGVALSPIHNVWLTNLLTNSKGEVMFFLPAFGYLLVIMGAGLFLLNNWSRVKEVGWGDRRIIYCLMIIVVAIALSGSAYTGWQDRIAPLGMGLSLFALYLTSRVIGKAVFVPLAVGVVAASLGIIAYAIWHPGTITGGFLFERNRDIATGYILMGTVLFNHKWQWLLAGLAVIALFLSGSAEAIFAGGVIVLAVMIRRDFGKKLVAVGVILAMAVAFIIISGWGYSLYRYTVGVAQQNPTAIYQPSDGDVTKVSPIAVRVLVIRDAFKALSPLGDGYNLTNFTRQTVHNVPLILVQQMGWTGILAGIAWLWVSIWCLIKTKWKYAWVSILALAVFDHYMWTQLAPVFWLVVGVSTADIETKTDMVFRDSK